MGSIWVRIAFSWVTWIAGDVPFDPLRDLPGFREVEALKLEYHVLFELERFENAKGRIPESEVERLRSEWATIHDRAWARIRAIESDPYLAAEFAFEKAFRLEVEKHFPRRRFEAAEIPRASDRANSDSPPTKLGIEIRYQVPNAAEKFYGEAIGKNYGRMIESLVRHFEAEYVAPLGLAPRPGHRPFLALVVLEDRAAYERLFVAKTQAEPSFVRAHYDPLRGMAFSYEPGTTELTKEKQQAVLHEMTHALLDAYRGAGDHRVPVWLNEGFAEYLSHCHGHVATTNFVFGAKPERAMLELDDFFADEESPYLFSIEDLFRIESYGDAASILSARAAAAGKQIDASVALAVLYKQAHVLVWWLDRHAGPESSARFRKYLAAELSGKGGFAAFRAEFGFSDARDFDRRFIAAIRDVPRLGSAPGEVEAPQPVTKPSRFGAISFTLAPATASARRGSAFVLARNGDLVGALEAARDATLPTSDLDFLSRLAATVDGVLAGLRSKGVTIAVPVGTKPDGSPDNIQGKVIRHDAKQIVLLRTSNKQEYVVDRSRYGLEEALQHAAKAGFDLAQLDRGRMIGLLGDDDPKLLAALGIKKSDLAALAPSVRDIGDAVESAKIRTTLEGFAALANRADADEAEAALTRLEDLLSSSRSHEEVVANRAVLREFAGQLLEQVYRSGRRDGLLLATRIAPLQDGRVELRYSFDSTEQLGDFENVDIRPGWLGDRPKIAPNRPAIIEGAASLRGYSALAHRARFAGDFELEYEFMVNTQAAAQFVSYFGDLDAARLVQIAFASEVTVFHGAGNARSKPLVPIDDLRLQQKERVRVEQREGRLRATSRDRNVEFDSAIRDSSRLLLLTLNSVAEIRLEEVVIRGTFDPRWLEKAVAPALDAALATMFPP